MMRTDTSLIKHSAAIHMACSLSTNERKVYNFLLQKALPSLGQSIYHEVDLTQLEALLDAKSNNRFYVKNLLDGLMGKKARYNIFDKDKASGHVWRQVSILLPEVAFSSDNRRCRYAFPNGIVELLKNPNLYARIDLAIQSTLTVSHALPLYEYFIDLLGANRREVKHRMEIKNIRDLLDLKKDQYVPFKAFNRDVFVKSIKDINANTDVHVDILGLNYVYSTESRRKRQVQSFNLYVCRKDKRVGLNSMAMDVPELPAPGPKSIRERLLSVFDGKVSTVNNLLGRFVDEEYVRTNLEYAEQRYKSGKVKNFQAYVCASLENNYAHHSTQMTLCGMDDKDPRSKVEKEDDARRAAETERYQKARQEVMKLEEAVLESLIKEFEDTDGYRNLLPRHKERQSKVYLFSLTHFYMQSKTGDDSRTV